MGFDIRLLKNKSDTIDHEHLNYFNPFSMSLLLKNCGYRVLEIFTPGKLDAELVRKKILSGDFVLEKEDEFIKHVFSELYRQDTVFSILEIIDLVKRRPDILNINANSELTSRWRQHQQRLQKGFVKQ